VTLARFAFIVAYVGYLVNVGLFMTLLPWSRAWGQLLTQLPSAVAALLDLPWLRGIVSAFGVLHLALVAWEIVHPTLLTPSGGSETSSGEPPA
jgi:hypothetical protein